jgi:hypothetical protein
MVRIFKSSKEAYTTLPSPYAHYGILTTQGLWNQAGAKQLSFDLRNYLLENTHFHFIIIMQQKSCS